MNECECGRYYEGDYDACAYCRPVARGPYGQSPSAVRADWLAEANCRDMDTDLFFDPDWRTKEATERKLRVVCMACPVRRACLDDALHFESFRGDGYREGFRGGMTAAERGVEARKRAARPERAERAFRLLRGAL